MDQKNVFGRTYQKYFRTCTCIITRTR